MTEFENLTAVWGLIMFVAGMIAAHYERKSYRSSKRASPPSGFTSCSSSSPVNDENTHSNQSGGNPKN